MASHPAPWAVRTCASNDHNWDCGGSAIHDVTGAVVAGCMDRDVAERIVGGINTLFYEAQAGVA